MFTSIFNFCHPITRVQFSPTMFRCDPRLEEKGKHNDDKIGWWSDPSSSLSKIHGIGSRRVEKYRRTKRGIIKEEEGMETGHRPPRRSLHRIRKNSGCARIEADGIRKSGGRKRGAARDRTCSPSLANRIYICWRAQRSEKSKPDETLRSSV